MLYVVETTCSQVLCIFLVMNYNIIPKLALSLCVQGQADNPKVNAIVLLKGPAADAGMCIV